MRADEVLIPGQAKTAGAWWWGTVTSVAPLAVRKDGDSAALLAEADPLVQVLEVGARVWCQLVPTTGQACRLIVHGPAPAVLDDSGRLLQAALPLLAAVRGVGGVPYATAAGQVSVALSASSFGSASVTFPVGRFGVAPLVIVTQTSLPASSGKLIAKLTGKTTSGFTAYAYTGDGTSVTASATFDWVAIQMTDSAAAG